MQTSKPVLIEAGVLQNGAPAFTVQYKNRFLYSKYNPTKNIVSAIENTEILPGTLVFVFSPCIFYGIETLIKKCGDELGKSVFVVAVECERELYNLTVSRGSEQGQKTEADAETEAGSGVQLFPREYLTADGVNLFLQNLASSAVPKIEGLTLPVPGILRRAIRFDFSGGVAFNAEFYNQIFTLSQNAIAQFWKNRLTLVKLGRLYCKNIFKNLPVAAGVQKTKGFEGALKFENLEKTVDRPILVLGAGESLEQFTVSRGSEQKKVQKPQVFGAGNFYIIAVDAALSPLLAAGIVPDAVVASEAQLAIEKAYIGATSQATQGIEAAKKPILFCDLTSRHTIPRMECFEPCFFFSEFEKNNFTERLKQKGVLPRTLPPLGSVGITATYIATLLRANDDVPIYVSGLDFSFSLGKTHANGTMAHKTRLLATNRLNPLANYGATIALGTEKIIGKNGEEIFTTKNLFGYATLFKNFFAGTKNLFDCGTSGVDLGITVSSSSKQGQETGTTPCGYGTIDDVESPASNDKGFANSNSIEPNVSAPHNMTKSFLEEERAALLALADILTNGENAKSRDKSIPYNEQILQLLNCREYLYLHFPDGAAPSLESSFLNRVRTQIDFFNKEIISALKKISPQK